MGSGKSEKIGKVFHIYVKAVYDQLRGHCMAEWKGVNGRDILYSLETETNLHLCSS